MKPAAGEKIQGTPKKGALTVMIEMLRELIHHKAYANASLLKAIREHAAAAEDPELRTLLHHTIVADRHWLWLILELPFVLEEETKIPETLAAITALYRETYARENAWLAQADETALDRILRTPFLPNFTCTAAQALLQLCLHSQGHRSQCASRLRSLGGNPPTLDFILWLKERPAPEF